MHNTSLPSRKSRLKSAFSKISPHTIKFLKPLLFVILLEFLWFVLSFYIDIRSDYVKALAFYSPILEYIMMSLLLTIGCAVIFDISIYKINKK